MLSQKAESLISELSQLPVAEAEIVLLQAAESHRLLVGGMFRKEDFESNYRHNISETDWTWFLEQAYWKLRLLDPISDTVCEQYDILTELYRCEEGGEK